MKKALVLLSFALSGCAGVAETIVRAQDAMGLTSEYDRLTREALRGRECPPRRPPAGTPDGMFSAQSSNGRVLKSIVRNGAFAEFVDVYHPNGKLHSHTPVNGNGAAEGWSQGYAEDGRLRTRVLYRNGCAIRYQRLDDGGGIAEEGRL